MLPQNARVRGQPISAYGAAVRAFRPMLARVIGNVRNRPVIIRVPHPDSFNRRSTIRAQNRPPPTVPGLKTQCMKIVLSQIKSVTSTEDDDDAASSNPLLDALPEALLEELQQMTFRDNYPGCTEQLMLLTSSHTARLNLGNWGPVTPQTALKLSHKCQNLTYLNLRGQINLPAEILCEIVLTQGHLQRLILENTQANDKLLQQVALACPHLQELNVAMCPAITDNGVLSLCGSASDASTPCSSLKKLNLSETSVGEEGLTISLVKLKNLEHFEHKLLYILLARIHQYFKVGDPVLPEETYKLKVIEFSYDGKCSLEEMMRFVEIACSFCPELTEVHLGAHVHDDCLNSLLKLRNLQTLSCFSKNISIGGGLGMVLWGCGTTLTKLDMSYIVDINLCALGKLCPNLVDLQITPLIGRFSQLDSVEAEPCPESSPCQQSRPIIFTKLRHLTLCQSGIQGMVTAHSLQVLLGHCTNLQRLSLEAVPCLNDDLLLELVRINEFSNLVYWVLGECPITAACLSACLPRLINLRTLIIHNIPMTERQVQKIITHLSPEQRLEIIRH